MHKSWKIEYVEDSLNRTDFVTWVKNHKIISVFFKHTLQTLVGMLRDVSGRK